MSAGVGSEARDEVARLVDVVENKSAYEEEEHV
jgi:hypothetical protein